MGTLAVQKIDRRNITNADLARWIKELDRRQKKGGNNPAGINQHKKEVEASTEALTKQPTKTAAETAAIVGTSQATVERFRVVQDRAGDEAIFVNCAPRGIQSSEFSDSIKDGKLTMRGAPQNETGFPALITRSACVHSASYLFRICLKIM